MATFTTNYNLRKPATSDFITVSTDINDNMDIIDDEIKAVNDLVAAHAAVVSDRFHYQIAGNQSIAHATDTDMIWDQEVSDPNGMCTSPMTTFTVPTGKGGLWAFNAVVHWQDSVATDDIRAVQFEINGALRAADHASAHTGIGNAASNSSVCWVGYLNAGDTVKVTVFQNSGGALDIEDQSSSVRTTEFSGVRIA